MSGAARAAAGRARSSGSASPSPRPRRPRRRRRGRARTTSSAPAFVRCTMPRRTVAARASRARRRGLRRTRGSRAGRRRTASARPCGARSTASFTMLRPWKPATHDTRAIVASSACRRARRRAWCARRPRSGTARRPRGSPWPWSRRRRSPSRCTRGARRRCSRRAATFAVPDRVHRAGEVGLGLGPVDRGVRREVDDDVGSRGRDRGVDGRRRRRRRARAWPHGDDVELACGRRARRRAARWRRPRRASGQRARQRGRCRPARWRRSRGPASASLAPVLFDDGCAVAQRLPPRAVARRTTGPCSRCRPRTRSPASSRARCGSWSRRGGSGGRGRDGPGRSSSARPACRAPASTASAISSIDFSTPEPTW